GEERSMPPSEASAVVSCPSSAQAIIVELAAQLVESSRSSAAEPSSISISSFEGPAVVSPASARTTARSEERRVGKEGRWRRGRGQEEEREVWCAERGQAGAVRSGSSLR